MPRTSDVIIVGGGVVGCAIAYELAKQKVRVELLEQRQLCMGATHASAGMVAPLSDAQHDPKLMDLGLRSFRMYDTFLREVEETSGLSIECLPSGILRVALTEEDERELRQQAKWAAELRFTVQWLTAREALESEPLLSPAIRGATFSPGEPQLSPTRYVEALRRAALAHGAVFREHTPVSGLAHNPDASGRVTGVRVGGETVSAGLVILAMGSWSSAAGDWLGLHVPVFPVRGEVVYVDRLARPLRHTVTHSNSYAAPKGDGLTLVGTTRERAGFDQRNTVAGIAGILTRIQDLIPSMAGASIHHTRAGLRPASADEMPILGPAPGNDGVILATGHGRSGILLAPVTASIITDVVLKGPKGADLGPSSAARLAKSAA